MIGFIVKLFGILVVLLLLHMGLDHFNLFSSVLWRSPGGFVISWGWTIIAVAGLYLFSQVSVSS